MLAANGDGHPPDADRERITPERTEVKRLDRNALIKAELTQAARFALAKHRPIDRIYLCASAKREIVEGGWRGYCD